MDRCLQAENNPELLPVSLTLPSLPFSFPICFFSHTSFFCPPPSFLPWTRLRPIISPCPGHALLFPMPKWCDAGDGWEPVRAGSRRAPVKGALASWVTSQPFSAISSHYAVIIAPFCLFPGPSHYFSLFYILSITFQGFVLFYPPIAITVLKRKPRLLSTTHLSFQYYD